MPEGLTITHEDERTEDRSQLDDEAREVLAFLEELSARLKAPIDAEIDHHGIVEATVSTPRGSLALRAGDGWDRVIWTAPGARPREWRWDGSSSPAVIRALVAGRAEERRTTVRNRTVRAEFVCVEDGVEHAAVWRNIVRRWHPLIRLLDR